MMSFPPTIASAAPAIPSYTGSSAPGSVSTFSNNVFGLNGSMAGVGMSGVSGSGFTLALNGQVSVPGSVGLGGPMSVAGTCGGASVAATASPYASTYNPCFQFHVNANPALYMMGDTACNVAQVCCDTGKAYRSYAVANQFGLNMYLSKGQAVTGACAKQYVIAPMTAGACACSPPWAC